MGGRMKEKRERMKEIKTHREDKQMRQRDGADMSKSDRERESKRSIYP